MRAHTFDVLICSNILLIAATRFENVLQLFQICSNFIQIAATLFYLQQLYFICSNFVIFVATFLNLQQLFNFQYVLCGPPYSGYVNVTRDTANVSYISSNQWGKTICHLRSRNRFSCSIWTPGCFSWCILLARLWFMVSRAIKTMKNCSIPWLALNKRKYKLLNILHTLWM